MDTMQTLPYNPDSVPDSQLSPKEGEMSPIQPLKGLSPSPSILKQTSSYTLNTAMDEGNEGDQEKGEEEEESNDEYACPDHGDEIIDVDSDQECLMSPHAKETSRDEAGQKHTNNRTDDTQAPVDEWDIQPLEQRHEKEPESQDPPLCPGHTYPDTQPEEEEKFEAVVADLDTDDEKADKDISKGAFKVGGGRDQSYSIVRHFIHYSCQS